MRIFTLHHWVVPKKFGVVCQSSWSLPKQSKTTGDADLMVTVVKTGRASMTAWTAKTKNVTLAEKLFDRCNTYLPAVVFFAWRVYKATQRCTRRIMDIGERSGTWSSPS